MSQVSDEVPETGITGLIDNYVTNPAKYTKFDNIIIDYGIRHPSSAPNLSNYTLKSDFDDYTTNAFNYYASKADLNLYLLISDTATYMTGVS
jgi:hypothetical protein